MSQIGEINWVRVAVTLLFIPLCVQSIFIQTFFEHIAILCVLFILAAILGRLARSKRGNYLYSPSGRIDFFVSRVSIVLSLWLFSVKLIIPWWLAAIAILCELAVVGVYFVGYRVHCSLNRWALCQCSVKIQLFCFSFIYVCYLYIVILSHFGVVKRFLVVIMIHAIPAADIVGTLATVISCGFNSIFVCSNVKKVRKQM